MNGLDGRDGVLRRPRRVEWRNWEAKSVRSARSARAGPSQRDGPTRASLCPDAEVLELAVIWKRDHGKTGKKSWTRIGATGTPI